MTEVSFYHLTTLPLEKVLPKLLEKVLDSGEKAVLIAKNQDELERINKFLWTYSKGTFLAHGMKEDGNSDRQPIYLTLEEENPNEASFLVTVEGVEPDFTDKFARCLDIFDGHDDDEVAKARTRWSNYKDKNYELKYWQQDEKGSWQNVA